MPVSGRTISIAILLLVAGPASAQVINGESTYGDSDLHRPPADAAPPDGKATAAETPPPRDTPERHPEKP